MAPSLAAKAVAGGFGGGTAFLEALWMATTEIYTMSIVGSVRCV